ncbi:MAG: hypothetical protein KUG64_10690 [Cycloclasticus sp.]|nr:hypothetical protein [Cycloclasticus sp.]
MSLNLAGLSTYTDEQKMDLVRASLLSGKTLSLISVQPDIKSSAAINILSSTAVWAAGACGFSAAGSTILTQRVLTVAAIKKNETICVDDLEAYYTQSKMKAGSYNEAIPFEQSYSEELAGQTSKFVEQLAWQGDTGGAGNMVLTDGFVKLIDAEGTVVTGTALAMDAANIIDAVDEMVAAIPEDVVDGEDLTLFMGTPEYRILAKAYRDANLYHYDGKEGADFEMFIAGTNIKVVAVGGLNGLARMFLCEASNLFAGTDLLNDAEQFKIFYSEDNDEVRIIQKMKIGFNMAFPARIVSN